MLQLTLFLAFLFSGAFALIYEVLWMRYLTTLLGSTLIATTTILMVFMLGLMLGALWAKNHLLKRYKAPVLVYGYLEMGIALYAFFTPFLLRWVNQLFYGLNAGFTLTLVLKALFMLVFLILPTVCMGATLPLLSHFIAPQSKNMPRYISILYALNTCGAVLGTWLAGFYFLPLWGVNDTLLICSILNFLLGVLMVLAGGKQTVSPANPEKNNRVLSKWPLVIVFVSGFVAMTQEVAWTRLLGMILGSSAYAFSLMLGTFLLGLASGSFALGFSSHRKAKQLYGLALFLLVFVGVETLLLTQVINLIPFGASKVFLALKSQGFSLNDTQLFFGVKALIVFGLMYPLAFILGGMFPLAVGLLSQEGKEAGEISARVYIANTWGSILGSAAAGFVLVPLLGLTGTLFLAALIALGLAGFLAFKSFEKPLSRVFTLALVSCLVVTGALFRSEFQPWILFSQVFMYPNLAEEYPTYEAFRNNYSQEKVRLEYYKDGLTSSVAIANYPKIKAFELYTDGKSDAIASYAAEPNYAHLETYVYKLLSHIPLLLKPKAKKALVIGLGSGVTAGSASLYPLEALKVVEIEKHVVEASRLYFPQATHQVLDNPRVEVIVDDARHYLSSQADQFDVIISQSSHPWRTGSSRLFTQDFWQLVKDKLSPDGVFVQWMQTYSIPKPAFYSLLKTYHSVFPEVLVFYLKGDLIVVGSKKPIDLKAALFDQQPLPTAVLRDFRQMNIGNLTQFIPLDIMAILKTDQRFIQSLPEAPLNTDDNSFVEYKTAQSFLTTQYKDILKLFEKVPPPPPLKMRDAREEKIIKEHLKIRAEQIYQRL